jgi:hypothetical protein
MDFLSTVKFPLYITISLTCCMVLSVEGGGRQVSTGWVEDLPISSTRWRLTLSLVMVTLTCSHKVINFSVDKDNLVQNAPVPHI